MVFVQYWVVCLLATVVSLPQILGNGSQQKESIVKLDVYHVHGSKSPLSANHSISYLDVLAHDESRAKALANRITNKKHGKSAISNRTIGLLGPESINVPISPGVSIGSGNYFAKVGFGSPAKYYAMILDTGSSLSWLQCRPCVIYCHSQVDPLFEPSASKSYRPLYCKSSQCSMLKDATLNDPLCELDSNKCVYTASYGDSSYSIGYLSQDVLSLNPKESLPNFVYGCGQDNEGLFGKSSGIIGLARQKLSMLYQLAPKYGYAFSYCLPRGGGGGFLSLGKASLTASAFKFTPMLTPSRDAGLYSLRMAAIKIAGKPLGVSASAYSVPTIIDSGTVITRLPDSVYSSLKRVFTQVMSKKYSTAPSFSILDTCFKGSSKGMTVPPFQLVFQGGAELNLAAANALIDVPGGITCLAFAPSSSIAIIGNHQQQTFTVAYDVANSRIGFAPGGCH